MLVFITLYYFSPCHYFHFPILFRDITSLLFTVSSHSLTRFLPPFTTHLPTFVASFEYIIASSLTDHIFLATILYLSQWIFSSSIIYLPVYWLTLFIYFYSHLFVTYLLILSHPSLSYEKFPVPSISPFSVFHHQSIT